MFTPQSILSNVTSVAEAEQIIFRYSLDWGAEDVPLAQAWGRVLREDLHADRDFPPFDRVAMDGIAIRHEVFAAGRRRFEVAGLQAAGTPPLHLGTPGHCIEVMTGAVLPAGTDTVVRYEDLRLENDCAEILSDSVEPRQNIHPRAIDRRAGDLLVAAGQVLAAPEIATAATVGKTTLRVARLPRVAVVSTGDELVEVAETPLPHQIRRSNAYAVQALLAQQFRLETQLFHVADRVEELTAGLREALENHDLLVLTGAVSEGKFDYVPRVLEALGVEKCFHKVAQRPGKPFWFGHRGRRVVVFALPGNPVSVFLCARRYLLPYLQRCLGASEPARPLAVLSKDVLFKPALTYFLPVKLHTTAEAVLQALPLPGHGSGDLANLNDADAFLELPNGQDIYRAGERYPVFRFREANY